MDRLKFERRRVHAAESFKNNREPIRVVVFQNRWCDTVGRLTSICRLMSSWGCVTALPRADAINKTAPREEDKKDLIDFSKATQVRSMQKNAGNVCARISARNAHVHHDNQGEQHRVKLTLMVVSLMSAVFRIVSGECCRSENAACLGQSIAPQKLHQIALAMSLVFHMCRLHHTQCDTHRDH